MTSRLPRSQKWRRATDIPDRETGLSCSVCERPICTDCATFAAVGIRCPEHSGKPQGVEKVTRSVRRAHYEGSGAVVTRALIAINIIVYLATVATGGGINANRGTIFEHGVLYGPDVAAATTGVLLTSAFMHFGPIHLGMNMLVLWFVGAPLEERMGRGRFLLLYLGRAWPERPARSTRYALRTHGRRFGRHLRPLRRGGRARASAQSSIFGSWLYTVIIINLAFTFGANNISIGGHIGGLIGGALAMLALSRFGRTHALYGRAGILGYGVLFAIGAGSVGLAILTAPQVCLP